MKKLEETESILAIDPGSDKCGVAVVSAERVVLKRCIVTPERVAETVRELAESYGISKIAIGDATASKKIEQSLSALFPHLTLVFIDEKNSTLEARSLYWEAHPSRGWRRVLPLSLQLPPVPIDDFAAVVLALRALAADAQQRQSVGN